MARPAPKRRGETATRRAVAPTRSSTRRAAAKPARAKRSTRSAESLTAGIKPIKQKLSQGEIFEKILEGASSRLGREVSRKEVKAFWNAFLEDVAYASLIPGSVGQVTIPGIGIAIAKKYPAKKIAAIKKGTMVKNPFNGGKEEPHKGRAASVRPATVKPRIRPNKKMKMAVLGE